MHTRREQWLHLTIIRSIYSTDDTIHENFKIVLIRGTFTFRFTLHQFWGGCFLRGSYTLPKKYKGNEQQRSGHGVSSQRFGPVGRRNVVRPNIHQKNSDKEGYVKGKKLKNSSPKRLR